VKSFVIATIGALVCAAAIIGLLCATDAFAQSAGDQPLPGKGRIWSETQSTTRAIAVDAGQVGISLRDATACIPSVCATSGTLYSGTEVAWVQDSFTGQWGPWHAKDLSIANECQGSVCCYGASIGPSDLGPRFGRLLYQSASVVMDAGTTVTVKVQCSVSTP